MSSKKIVEKFTSIISHSNDEDEINFEADRMYLETIVFIQTLLESKEISEVEFAKSLGVEVSIVSKWFLGELHLTFKDLARIQKVLGLKIKIKIDNK